MQRLKALILLVCVIGQVAATTYYIEIKTSSVDYADTDAISASITLTGDNGSVDLGELDNPGVNDLESGATDTFTFTSAVDIGNLECVTLYVGGADAWLFDWVGVSSNQRPARQYLYNNNSTWMSSDATEGESELELCVEVPLIFYIEIRTSSVDYADTDAISASITLTGDNGYVDLGELDDPRVNDFESGAIDTFTFTSAADVGEVQCITLSVGDEDAWLFEWISVSSNQSPEKQYLYNTDEKWMSSDTVEGENQLEICVQPTLPEIYHTFYIVTQTATGEYSGSDNLYLTVTIEGSKGTAETDVLDNPDWNDFEKGARDVFEVRVTENELGHVKCITLAAGGDDAWEFLWIEVHSTDFNKQSYFYNTKNDVISSDTTEGTDQLQLCL